MALGSVLHRRDSETEIASPIIRQDVETIVAMINIILMILPTWLEQLRLGVGKIGAHEAHLAGSRAV